MAQCDPERYKQELVSDRIATAFGFGRVSNWLEGQSEILPEIPASYLLVATALFIDMGVLDTINRFTGRNSLVDDPGKVFIIFGLMLAVVGVRWMNSSYARTVADLQLPERDIENDRHVEQRLENIIPFKLTVSVYLGAVLLYFANLQSGIGIQGAIEVEGVVRALIGNFLILPLVAVPLIVEFGLLYVAIHILLPRHIARADLDMFFYDPQNMGGFGPVGQLLKRSYYLYTGGLLLFFSLGYWPVFLSNLDVSTPYPGPDMITAVFFSIMWVIGICTIGYSMYRMHTLMSRKKQEAIRDIEAQIKTHLDDPFDITTDHLEDPELRAEFEHKIAEVRNTKRYPSTFTMWSQIMVSVLLPQALQLALQIFP